MGEGVALDVGVALGEGVAVGLGVGDAVGEGVAVGTGVAVGDGVGVAVGEGVGDGVGVGEATTFRATACPLMEKAEGVLGGAPLKVKPMVALPPFAARVEVQLAGVTV